MSVAIQMKLVAVEEREFHGLSPTTPPTTVNVTVRMVTFKVVGGGSPLDQMTIQIPVRDATDWPELLDVGQNYDLTITRG